MKLSIKNISNPTLPVSVLLVAGCLIFWLVSFLFNTPSTLTGTHSAVTDIIKSGLSFIDGLSSLVSLAIVIFNAFLIAQLNNKFTLIRNRTFLPVFIYLFLLSSWSDSQILTGVHLTTSLVLLSLFMLFGSYRNRMASEAVFTSAFLISIGGIFIFPVLFLLPVYWIGMVQLKSFSFKTFLASVFGYITPWILYLTIRYYFQPDLVWLNELWAVDFGLTVLYRSLYELVYLALLVLIGIVAVAGLISELNKDSLQTRSYLTFMITLEIALFLLTMILPMQYGLLVSVTATLYALLVSHPLTLKQSNFYSILFYVFCAINITYFVFKLIY